MALGGNTGTGLWKKWYDEYFFSPTISDKWTIVCSQKK
jgi:hypothetical protein